MGNDDYAERELTQAIAEFKALVDKNRDRTVTVRGTQELAGAYNSLGNLYMGVGKQEQAVPMYQLSLENCREFTELVMDSDGPKAYLLRSMAYINLASALRDLSRNADAEDACRKAVGLLTVLVDHYPNEPDYQVKLGWAHQGLGAALRNQQLANTSSQYEKAISILREWSDKCSNVPWAKSILGNALLDNGSLIATDSMSRQLKKSELLLEESTSIFRQLAEQFPNQPDYRVSLTKAQLQLAGLFREMGNFPKSASLLEETIPIQQSLVDEFPTRPDYRADLAKLLYDFSGMSDYIGKSDPSQSDGALRQAIEIFEILVRDFPGVPDYRLYLVMGYYNLGDDLRGKGQAKDAEQAYQHAVSVAAPLVEEFPDNPRYRSQLSDVYSQRAGNLLTLKDFDTASMQFQLALEITDKLISEQPENLFYQEQRINLQFNFAVSKLNLDEGEKLFIENLAFREKLIERNPSNPVYRFNYALCHANLATTYSKTERQSLAAVHFEKALEIVQELVQKYPLAMVKQDIAKYFSNLINVYTDMGDFDKARGALRAASTCVTEFIDQHPENRSLLERLVDIAAAAKKLGEHEQSIELLKHCAEVSESGFGNADQLTLRVLNQLGIAHIDLLEWQAADDCFGSIIETRGKIKVDDPTNTKNLVMLGGALCNRGNGLLSTDSFDAAIDNYTEAIEILQSVDDPKSVAPMFLSNSYEGRGTANRKSGRLKESVADFDAALQLTSGNKRSAELHLARLKTEAVLGNYLDAVNDVEGILKEPEMDHLAYSAAGVFAIAADVVRSDETMAQNERQEKFKDYCNRVFELLEIARSNDYFNDAVDVNDLLNDPDWSAIRDDQRYEKLKKTLDDH